MRTGRVSANIAIGAGIIGFVLIASGVGCAVAGFVWTAYGKGAHGVWSGIFMIIVGTLGAVILCTKNRGIMVAFLVSCIIDLFINMIQAIIAAILAALVGILKDALDDDKCKMYGTTCICFLSSNDARDIHDSSIEIEDCDDINAMVAILRAVTAFSVIGMIATFAGSIIGCIGACCDRGSEQPGIVVIQPGQQPQMQTTTVQTYHQAPLPPQQNPPPYPMGQQNPGAYPMDQQNPGAYPTKQQNQPAYPMAPMGNDPEMGQINQAPQY